MIRPDRTRPTRLSALALRLMFGVIAIFFLYFTWDHFQSGVVPLSRGQTFVAHRDTDPGLFWFGIVTMITLSIGLLAVALFGDIHAPDKNRSFLLFRE